MRRVLVTGASGFIGRALAHDLAGRGWTVVAASRAPLPGLPERVTTRILPDLREPVDWDRCLEHVDAVVHAAGIAHATTRIPAETYHRVNVLPTAQLAQAAARRGAHLVFLSSVRAQTGPSADRVLTEDDPARPTDDYGRSKLAAEDAVRESGVRHTILRPTLVYGEGVRGNLAALLRLAALPVPLPFGALDNRRSLVSRENLSSAVEFVLDRTGTEGQTFLVAEPDPPAVRDLLAAMREGMHRPPHLIRLPPTWLAAALRLAGREEDWNRISGSLVVSSARLARGGWTPLHGTRDGLLRMAAAYARRPA